MHAVDAHSGARKWSYRTGGGVDSSPSTLDDVVYVLSTTDGALAPQARHAYEFLRQIDLGATSVRLWP